ncbi:MAG: hypothetical protein VX836_09140 [Pseudomonadota bacterium]|nr:hypothetical protein [Pseudomonadota bacterium]
MIERYTIVTALLISALAPMAVAQAPRIDDIAPSLSAVESISKPGLDAAALTREPGPTAPPRAPREAAQDAQKQYGGRVLSVRLIKDKYRVKLLKDGEVRVVQVPAR